MVASDVTAYSKNRIVNINRNYVKWFHQLTRMINQNSISNGDTHDSNSYSDNLYVNSSDVYNKTAHLVSSSSSSNGDSSNKLLHSNTYIATTTTTTTINNTNNNIDNDNNNSGKVFFHKASSSSS